MDVVFASVARSDKSYLSMLLKKQKYQSIFSFIVCNILVAD
jgi:hypothetical protein